MTTITNTAAYGNYCGYREQAKQAHMRRFALLHNLAMDIKKCADGPREDIDPRWRERLAEAEAAQRERDAAIAEANRAAALCGERDVVASQLSAP